jgi:molybdopterin converting factor small subunit
MKIKIEVLGLPALSQALGKKEIELDIPGGSMTVQTVIHSLIQEFGPSAGKALYDPKGNLDSTIQIALNGEKFISPDRLDTPLEAGDTLTFMLLMAGGAEVRPSTPD